MAWKPITAAGELIGRHETSTFDAKGSYDNKAGRAFEMAKDIAAFASAMGGSVVIGAIENKKNEPGTIVAFKSVSAARELIAEISQAVIARCRPLAMFEPEIIELSEGEQEAVTGRAATAPATIVVLNVPPLVTGPVGVLAGDEISDDTYKFPVRRGDRSRYLRPEEIAMQVDSHERRIAIRLLEIPGVRGEDELAVQVRVFHRKSAEGSKPQVYKLQAIDLVQQTILLHWNQPAGAGDRLAVVPMSYLRAIWREARDDLWSIDVDGTLFARDAPAFCPAGRA